MLQFALVRVRYHYNVNGGEINHQDDDDGACAKVGLMMFDIFNTLLLG
jgi:hypothetical protein